MKRLAIVAGVTVVALTGAGTGNARPTIFVANLTNGATGEYTTSGKTVKASLISRLSSPAAIAIANVSTPTPKAVSNEPSQATQVSPQATAAKQKYKAALEEAKKAYAEAVIRADQQYVNDLKGLLDLAMRSLNIDLARAIDDQMKAAEEVLQRDITLNQQQMLAPHQKICRTSQGYSGGQCKGNVIVDSSVTLIADIDAVGNVSVNNGVVLATDGHSVIAGGSFENNGTIDTGRAENAGSGVGGGTRGNNGRAYASSYGGAGGGGGAGGMGGNNNPGQGGAGGPTTGSTGGTGGLVESANGGSGGDGATPDPPPSLSSSLINAWYSGGMQNYLAGAGGGSGGGGGNWGPPVPMSGSGGDGAHGLYIQASTIVAGNINADGSDGSRGGGGCGSGANGGGAGGGGGGGGGSLLFAYSDSGKYVSGAYNLHGGPGGAGGQDDVFGRCAIPNFNGGGGGYGGSGQVLAFKYTRQPVTAP